MTTSVRVIQREEQPDQHHPTAAAAATALPTVLECALPPGVAIKPNAYGHGLLATQRFESGAMLYLTSCLYVPDLTGTIALRILGTGEEFTLDMKEHSVAQPDKPGLRQLYTFDGGWLYACMCVVCEKGRRSIDRVTAHTTLTLSVCTPHSVHEPLLRAQHGQRRDGGGGR